MKSEKNFDRLNRNYGIFFIFMAALSLALAFHHRGLGQRELAWLLLAGALYFGAIGLWAITGPMLRRDREEDEGDGGSRHDRPMPIVPVPSHGLAPPGNICSRRRNCQQWRKFRTRPAGFLLPIPACGTNPCW